MYAHNNSSTFNNISQFQDKEYKCALLHFNK